MFLFICLERGKPVNEKFSRLLHLNDLQKEKEKNPVIAATASHAGSSQLLRGGRKWEKTDKHLVFLLIARPMNLKPCEIQRWEGFSQGAVQHSWEQRTAQHPKQITHRTAQLFISLSRREDDNSFLHLFSLILAVTSQRFKALCLAVQLKNPPHNPLAMTGGCPAGC